MQELQRESMELNDIQQNLLKQQKQLLEIENMQNESLQVLAQSSQNSEIAGDADPRKSIEMEIMKIEQ